MAKEGAKAKPVLPLTWGEIFHIRMTKTMMWIDIVHR